MTGEEIERHVGKISKVTPLTERYRRTSKKFRKGMVGWPKEGPKGTHNERTHEIRMKDITSPQHQQ